MSKKDFSVFAGQPDLVYLDSAATALKPQVVIDAMTDYYQNYSANIHRGIYSLSEKATGQYEQARDQVANLIGASAQELVFTAGTTAGINQVANSYRDILSADDEIVVPVSEHHANLLPWQRLCKQTSAKLVVTDPHALSADGIASHINDKTRVVAFTHVSNVLGNINPVDKLAEAIKTINHEVHILVDGAQAVPHVSVDIAKMNIDYYAFSAHKVYGPTGIGALWISPNRTKDVQPLIVGGGAISKVTDSSYDLLDMPQGLEAGTPPIAEAIGFGAAAEYLNIVSKNHLALTDYLYDSLDDLGFVTILGNKVNRVPLVSFVVEGIHAHDIAQFLADHNICVRAGHHCTMPLHRSLNISASVRASLGIYNTVDDIDALIDKLQLCHQKLGQSHE